MLALPHEYVYCAAIAIFVVFCGIIATPVCFLIRSQLEATTVFLCVRPMSGKAPFLGSCHLLLVVLSEVLRFELGRLFVEGLGLYRCGESLQGADAGCSKSEDRRYAAYDRREAQIESHGCHE